MARTNIVIDDDLVFEVMKRYALTTKRDAVDYALRRLVGPVLERSDMLAMEGSGWDGDLDELRSDPVLTL